MTDNFTIRMATLDDVTTLASHRRKMFEDMGEGEPAGLDAMTAAFIPWVSELIQRGDYRSWLAIAPNGDIAAGVDLMLLNWPPGPFSDRCKRPFVYNVYTEHPYRRKGLARLLMGELVNWCREQGYSAVGLHTSEEGFPLYKSMGFEETNEMHLRLGD